MSKQTVFFVWLCLFFAGALGSAGCQDSSPPTVTTEPQPDPPLKPPALDQPIEVSSSSTSLIVQWRTPKQTSSPPTSAPERFEVYYSRAPIFVPKLNNAVKLENVPLPGSAGTLHQLTIDNLIPEVHYYLAIRTVSQSGLFSALRSPEPWVTSPAAGWWTGFAERGVQGSVEGLVVYFDQLIVAGDFTGVGDLSVRNVAAWNGSRWNPMSTGIESPVDLLYHEDGRLLAGSSANGQLYEWSGQRWVAFAAPLPGLADVAIWRGDVYAVVSGTFGPHVAPGLRWDGTDWAPLAQVSAGNGCRHGFSRVLAFEDALYFFGSRTCPRFWEEMASIILAEKTDSDSVERASEFTYRRLPTGCGLEPFGDYSSGITFAEVQDGSLLYGIWGCRGSSCGSAEYRILSNGDCNPEVCRWTSDFLAYPSHATVIEGRHARASSGLVSVCDGERLIVGRVENGGLIQALVQYQGDLYIGGTFGWVDQLPSPGIARWVPPAWD